MDSSRGNLAEVVYRLDGEGVTRSYPLVKGAGDWRIDCFYDC